MVISPADGRPSGWFLILTVGCDGPVRNRLRLLAGPPRSA
jgi:hypothetical protein